MEKSTARRFWEVDVLRGLAVVMMIFYHLIYDLGYFGGYISEMRSGLWLFLAQATASIFIILVGVSLTLSASRIKAENHSGQLFLHLLKRGSKIFCLGMAITLVTYLAARQEFICFGVLHLIGISIVFSYPFLKARTFSLFAGSAFILIGLHIQDLYFDLPWLLWLGLAPKHFFTLDYFPVFPWFGVVLIGIFLGNNLYSGYDRRFDLPDLSDSWGAKLLGILGRNSLLIYLIHQPFLMLILFFAGMIPYPLGRGI